MNEKRFFAQFNDMSYLNIPADEMKVDGDYIYVYKDNKLVAFMDVGITFSAYMTDKAVKE